MERAAKYGKPRHWRMGQYLKKFEADSAAEIQRVESRLAELTKTKEWQATKTTADITGIVDPWPTSDLVSFSMSVTEGDWVGAVLSGVSFIPWLGDAAAKPVKLIRASKAVSAIDREVGALVKTLAHHRSTAGRMARRKEAAAAERARRANEAAKRYAEAMKCKTCPKPNRFGTHLPKSGKWSNDLEKGNSRWTSDDGSVSVNYKEGYPDFSTSTPPSIYPQGGGRVEIEMKGDKSDATTARDAMRSKLGDPTWPGTRGNAPQGYTWHHTEDGATMELVKSSVHNKTIGGAPHVGGESIVSGKDNLQQDSQF